MDEFTMHILRALVEGHLARAGLKERNRALTEYEIARRAGYTAYSYVEFSTRPERDQVRGALDELERGGWVVQYQRAGRYDSFLPTELGVRRVTARGAVAAAEAAMDAVDPLPAPRERAAAPPLSPEAALARLVQQMDEVLALLRSIDAKLGRDR
jgi:hypothetical protein